MGCGPVDVNPQTAKSASRTSFEASMRLFTDSGLLHFREISMSSSMLMSSFFARSSKGIGLLRKRLAYLLEGLGAEWHLKQFLVGKATLSWHLPQNCPFQMPDMVIGVAPAFFLKIPGWQVEHFSHSV